MMKKYFYTLLLFVSALQLANAQAEKLNDLLYELPDVIFTELEAPEGYQAAYELKIKQPLDHADASKGFFYQRVFLSHIDFEAPTVIVTQGYNRTLNQIGELANFLGANQIDVEHRFFGNSVPNSLDYKYLNLKQATADLHHIRTLFARMYKDKWVSTGISKGGATTIYYRYYYPNDVDVSVPYVAPINREVEDQRLYSFLESVGSDDCREKIRSFPGCSHLQLLQVEADPCVFFTYSHWEGEENLNIYRNSDLFRTVWRSTRKLFRAAPKAWSLSDQTQVQARNP